MTKGNATDDLRTVILDEAAILFNTRGIKFTMDDLARSLGMSKKTIYTVFRDKRSIMIDTIDRFFVDAAEAEQRILADETLGTAEKLRRIIGNVPERYANIDLSRLHVLKDRYPAVYRHWHQCREAYWSGAETLLRKGIERGELRPVSIPVFKTMFQATVEQFFQSEVLIHNKVSYQDALIEVADILVNGIITKDNH